MKKNDLALRTRVAFLVLGVFLVGLVAIYKNLRNQELDDGIPTTLRSVLEINGGFWQKYFSAARPNTGVAIAAGQKARTNGLIGLNDPVPDDYVLSIITDNDVDEPKEIDVSLAEIKSLPRVESQSEFYCIEGWSQHISYAGVRFSDLLKHYGIGTASGKKEWDTEHPPLDMYPFVGLETPDQKYYVSIDMPSMLHPQTVLAYEMNGLPLDDKHGAPLRLVIPVKYGIKNLKRVGTIFFSHQRPADYWAERGYDWYAGL